ncbi:radical SAM protein [bacterium]|nr:radical SAM protein [candidate division CSSED10-310 bacterium]
METHRQINNKTDNRIDESTRLLQLAEACPDKDQAKKSIFPVFLSGYACSGRCIYCNAALSSGYGAPPDFQALDRDLTDWLEKPDRRSDMEIAWYGNDLPDVPETVIKELLALCSRRAFNETIPGLRLSIRPDSVLKTPVKLLCAFSVVELGVPSMDPDILKLIRRGHEPNAVNDALILLRSLGIRTGFQTMVGLPGANAASDHRTAELLAALSPDFVRIHPTLVLHGTVLAEMADAGEYRPLDLEDAIERCADIWDIYARREIPVTRCGFHLPETERDRALHSGPWHPAFGQLVRSRRWRRLLDKQLSAQPDQLVLTVPPDDFSDAVGHKKENLRWLQEKHGVGVAVLKVES